MSVVALRSEVVGLLHRFNEPVVRLSWLRCQAVLWDCEPSEVLSLLVDGRPFPLEPFAMVAAGTRTEEAREVLDASLLRAARVQLVPNGYPAHDRAPWVDSVEALWLLMEELDAPVPALPEFGNDAGAWAQAATRTLVRATIAWITDDPTAAEISSALVWATLGVDVDMRAFPVPPVHRDPIDGWHHTLEVLTSARSAAATVLTVLGVEGGGRDIRPADTENERVRP